MSAIRLLWRRFSSSILSVALSEWKKCTYREWVLSTHLSTLSQVSKSLCSKRKEGKVCSPLLPATLSLTSLFARIIRSDIIFGDRDDRLKKTSIRHNSDDEKADKTVSVKFLSKATNSYLQD